MVSDQVGREKITIPVSDERSHRATQGNPPEGSESPQHGQGFCNGYWPISLRRIPAPAPRLTDQQQHHSGKQHTGFVVLESAESVIIRETNGLSRELLQDDIDDRVKQEISMMPKGVVDNLTCEQLADLIAYLQSLH